jgi:hypothetical protein
MHNKKILKQAEERAKKKVICLLNKMRKAGKEVNAIAINFNCLVALIRVAFSLTM